LDAVLLKLFDSQDDDANQFLLLSSWVNYSASIDCFFFSFLIIIIIIIIISQLIFNFMMD
jgi:hypothetical protein